MTDLIPPIPPHDPFAEQCTLGACLLDGSEVRRIRAEVQAEDFYNERHRHVFRAVLRLDDAGEAVNLFSVQDTLKTAGSYEDVGGVPYLSDLCNACSAPAQGAEYGRVVAELARRRRWIDGLRDTLQRSYSRTEDLTDLAQRAQQTIDAVLTRGGQEGTLLGYAAVEAADEFRRMKGEGLRLPTWGFPGLDSAFGGIPNKYILVAARPGMGKTTFTLHVSLLNARATGRWWVYISQETSTKLLAVNILGAVSGVDTADMQSGDLNEREWKRVEEHAVKLMQYPVYIVDTPNMSPAEVAQVALRYRHKAAEAGAELGGVVIDYLQLLRQSGTNGTERIDEISRQLVATQRTLGAPLIAISQMNRENEKDSGKRPQIHHLRGSGSLEQDARMVLMLYREGYYKRQANDWTQEDWMPEPVEVLVFKNNGGKTGSEVLNFTPAYTRFADKNQKWWEEKP